jgi:hypothetical protein
MPANERYIGAEFAIEKHPELKSRVDTLIATGNARCRRFVKSDIGGPDSVMA